jgi:hypothetical protein
MNSTDLLTAHLAVMDTLHSSVVTRRRVRWYLFRTWLRLRYGVKYRPLDLLIQATERDQATRIAAMMHPAFPVTGWDLLAGHPDRSIRLLVADNWDPPVPPRVACNLMEFDPDRRVREAAQIRLAPKKWLASLQGGDDIDLVISHVDELF